MCLDPRDTCFMRPRNELAITYPDHMKETYMIADIAFATVFESKFGKLVDLDLDDEDGSWHPIMRELNIYMNGVGFEPDDEDSDVDCRAEDIRLYIECSGVEVTWLDYVSDSRDA